MKKHFILSAGLLAAFALYTAALTFVDVQPIGPKGSLVGFAALNDAVHRALGVHMSLYVITDWLSIAALVVMLVFALLGLCQLIKRRSLLKVDRDILALGVFYIIVLATYCFFEVLVINRRPVLINGVLEASYPSSTTVLLLCVVPTAMMQVARRIKKRALRLSLNAVMGVFAVAMVLGRLVSGVHWVTDIIGGVMLSAALVSLYAAALRCIEGNKNN